MPFLPFHLLILPLDNPIRLRLTLSPLPVQAGKPFHPFASCLSLRLVPRLIPSGLSVEPCQTSPNRSSPQVPSVRSIPLPLLLVESPLSSYYAQTRGFGLAANGRQGRAHEQANPVVVNRKPQPGEGEGFPTIPRYTVENSTFSMCFQEQQLLSLSV